MDHEERYRETLATWNKVAQLYQDRFMNLDLYNDTYDFFCEHLPGKAPQVLEVGCGPGNITRYLLAKRPDMRIEATDASPDMVALAQQNNPSALCRVMDARALETLDEIYDAVVCGFCIPYLSPDDTGKCIRDSAGLLAKGGLLYLSFIAGPPDRSGYQAGSSGDKVYFYYHEEAYIRDLLADNHFIIVRQFHKEYRRYDDTTEVHTIFIAQKEEQL